MISVQLKRRRAKKEHSLVGMLVALAKAEEKELAPDGIEITTYKTIMYLAPDNKAVICYIKGDLFQDEELEGNNRLTLLAALSVPIQHDSFVRDLMESPSEWPQGIEYSYTAEEDSLLLNISMIVEIDFAKDAFADIDDYMDYAKELQLDLNKKYNIQVSEVSTAKRWLSW